jgi:hypothetical protein
MKETFEQALFDLGTDFPAYFWGDLDWSGMRILAAMRGTFQELQAWQPGYAEMLASLRAGSGHSPEAAQKRGQRPLKTTGCAYADEQLLPELRAQAKFVDQELFAF